MPTAKELVKDVADLVPLPRAYLRIRELVNDPNSSAADLSKVITNEPSMTARLLRLANSAFFGMPSRVETVQRAISVLGMNQIHDLALAMSAVTTMSGISGDLINMTRFWRRSVYCAVVARLLASRMHLADPERLFVAGLLHALGHVVLCFKLPDDMRAIGTSARSECRALFEVERERLGFDYAAVGGELLAVWHLPLSLQRSVSVHTVPTEASEYLVETAAVHLASVMAIAAEWKTHQDEPVPTFDPLAFQIVGMVEDDVPGLMREADQHVVEAILAIVPEPRTGRGSTLARAS